MKDNYGNELTIGDEVLIFGSARYSGKIMAMWINIALVKNNYTGDQYWYMGHDLYRVDIQQTSLSHSSPVDISGYATYISEPILKEKPCEICGKNNDIGVKKCWFCESVIK